MIENVKESFILSCKNLFIFFFKTMFGIKAFSFIYFELFIIAAYNIIEVKTIYTPYFFNIS